MKNSLRIVLILSLTLCLLSGAVITVAAFTPLYRLFAPKLAAGGPLDGETVVKNYEQLMDYCLSFGSRELHWKDLSMSARGEQHFREVRFIFQGVLLLFFLSLILTLCVYLLCRRKGLQGDFFRPTAFLLLLLPAGLALPLLLNFEAAFTAFHKLFFRNDYWLFDPAEDPIILYLPASFFFTEAALILALIFLAALFCFALSHRKRRAPK